MAHAHSARDGRCDDGITIHAWEGRCTSKHKHGGATEPQYAAAVAAGAAEPLTAAAWHPTQWTWWTVTTVTAECSPPHKFGEGGAGKLPEQLRDCGMSL